MVSLSLSILSILVIAEIVLGNFANVFIALMNCIDWVKSRKISCTDGILTALAVSRIGLLLAMVAFWHQTVFNTPFFNTEVKFIFHIIWIMSNHFSIWLAVCLSILYLLKIANFSSPFFFHLKLKARKVVLMILLGTLVFLVCHLAVAIIEEKMWMNEYEGNITWVSKSRAIVHLSNMTVFVIIHFIPFTLSLTALLLLLFSLWQHLKKMQLSDKGFQDASTKVHVRAMQTVVSFLLLYVIHFLAQITSIWNSNTLQNDSVEMSCEVFQLLYSSSHSFILIWMNRKLRGPILTFLRQLRCRLKERK